MPDKLNEIKDKTLVLLTNSRLTEKPRKRNYHFFPRFYSNFPLRREIKMAMFTSLNISATGMTAQQLRMDILSQNMANVGSTRTNDGTPYRRKNVVFEEKDANPFIRPNGRNNCLNQYM